MTLPSVLRLALAQAERRWRATHWRRSTRRSSSEVPPQMPLSWVVVRAYSRQACCTSHVRHTALAFSICSMAGPVVPTGKNRSGSVSRQALSSRQSLRSMDRDRLRLCVRATGPPRRFGSPRFVTSFTCHRDTERESVWLRRIKDSGTPCVGQGFFSPSKGQLRGTRDRAP